jgi:prevent-host-death family protein
MASYSVAEARNQIAELIDRAQAGETVTITRRGKPVADLVPRVETLGTPVDLEWIRKNRVEPEPPFEPEPDGVHWVQRLRERNEL